MQPIKAHTKTPFADIGALASKYSLDPSDIDFDILSYETTYQLKKDEEPEIINDKNRALFYDEKFMRNPSLILEQSYDVEYYLKAGRTAPLLPKITLGVNQNLTKVVVTVKEDSTVRYTPDFQQNMITQIQKQLVKAGVIIGMRDEVMYEEVAKLTYSLRIKEILDKAVRFVVCTGVEPILALDDRVIYHYLSKQKESGMSADRGFMSSIVAGDTVIEYVKPVPGTIGRDVKGQVVHVKDPQISIKEISFKTSDNIEIKENDFRVKYLAKISGYVEFKANTYDIKEEMSLEEVSFKKTGSIKTDIGSDVRLTVTEKDLLKDAVGAGMHLEANSIAVEGSVGKGASIKAQNASVGGQTHAKSTIQAEQAHIAVHLGSLECEGEASIGRLENGSVRAHIARIDSALGGLIIADEVYIKTLFSRCTIIAANVIEIGEVKGQDNRLVIDLMQSKKFKSRIESYDSRIKEIEAQILNLPKEIENKRTLIEHNKETVELIKSKVIELKKEGVTPPASLLNNLKTYQNLVYEYNEKIATLSSKKTDLKQLKEELATIQNAIFDSKIICKSRWKELNEVKIHLFEPRQDIVYVTKDNERAELMTLRKKMVGGVFQYEIYRSNES